MTANISDISDAFSGRPPAGYLTFFQYFAILKFLIALMFLFGTLAIFTNLVNLFIFKSIGFQEPVNICLFWLAVTDTVIALISLETTTTGALVVAEVERNIFLQVDPISLSNIGTAAAEILYATSMLITTYLAIARCCCVALPFHFRGIFTRSRTYVVIAVSAVVAVSSRAHYLYYKKLLPRTDPVTNRTRYYIVNTPEVQAAAIISYYINEFVLSPVPQAIVTVCVIIMAVKLREAWKFRQSSSSAVTTIKMSNVTGGSSITSNNNNSSAVAVSSKPSSDISTKELQVVTQVTLICTIFIVTNLPRIVSRLLIVFAPGFQIGQRYQKITYLVFSIRTVSELCSCAVNILVYYKYNSKFRARLQTMFQVVMTRVGSDGRIETLKK